MEVQAKPGQVANIFQEQLRAYIARHHERDYLLVDVREPDEYANGHIPGARLMPLSDFDVRVAELAKLEERDLVFYCRSGVRSARVSEYASLTIGFPHVFNLIGGFAAWSGSRLVEMPRLKSFQVSSDARAIVYQALELEKGAERLYAELVDHFSNTEAAVLMAELAGAEYLYRPADCVTCRSGHDPRRRLAADATARRRRRRPASGRTSDRARRSRRAARPRDDG